MKTPKVKQSETPAAPVDTTPEVGGTDPAAKNMYFSKTDIGDAVNRWFNMTKSAALSGTMDQIDTMKKDIQLVAWLVSSLSEDFKLNVTVKPD